jgi:hypothetical protein
MSAIRPDFDMFAERADDYGAHWATRILGRMATLRRPPREWPGTIDEARRVVESFAGRSAFVDRERLAAIVHHSARGEWTETLRAGRAHPREKR